MTSTAGDGPIAEPPEGDVCFRLKAAIQQIVPDPAAAARYTEEATDELTARYRQIIAGVAERIRQKQALASAGSKVSSPVYAGFGPVPARAAVVREHARRSASDSTGDSPDAAPASQRLDRQPLRAPVDEFDEAWRWGKADTADWFVPMRDRLLPEQWAGLRDSAPFRRVQTGEADVRTGSASKLRDCLSSDKGSIRFDLRRIEAAPGRWVREFDVRIQIVPGQEGFRATSGEVAALQSAALRGVAKVVNQGYRLPGGDQLHVRLVFEPPTSAFAPPPARFQVEAAPSDEVTALALVHEAVYPGLEALMTWGFRRSDGAAMHVAAEFDTGVGEADGLSARVVVSADDGIGERERAALETAARGWAREAVTRHDRSRTKGRVRARVWFDVVGRPVPPHMRVVAVSPEVRTTQAEWAVGSSPEVLAHEVLHLLGLPDEYEDPGQAFRGAASAIAVHRGDGSVMGLLAARWEPGRARLLPRHAWRIARVAGEQAEVAGLGLGSAGVEESLPFIPGRWDLEEEPAPVIRLLNDPGADGVLAGAGKQAEWAPSPRLQAAIEAYVESAQAYPRAVAEHLTAESAGLQAIPAGEGAAQAEVRQRTAETVAAVGDALEEALAELLEIVDLPVPAAELETDRPDALSMRGADRAAPGELRAHGARLLGQAADVFGSDAASAEMRARQHRAVERVAGLLADGDVQGAVDLAEEIGPDHGFLESGLAAGTLVVAGRDYSEELKSYPSAEQPDALARMVDDFRGRVLGDAESAYEQRPVGLPETELAEFRGKWQAIARKLMKIIAVSPGYRGVHPLVPGGAVGRNPDFGSKVNDAHPDSHEELVEHLLGWVKAKPLRRYEKTVARWVEESRDINLLLAAVLRRAAHKIESIGQNNPDVLRELRSGHIKGAKFGFGYTGYFGPRNPDLITYGLTSLISGIWADDSPERLYGAARAPERFSFRDKIMVLHDLADYFGDQTMMAGARAGFRMAPPIDPEKDLARSTEVDEFGRRRAYLPADGEFPARRLHVVGGRRFIEINEADAWTLLARERSIPIWNGPSTTTARMASFAGWLGATELELGAVAWGIFAFWRLHYDHSFSASHTLHEVMDIASNFGLAYSLDNQYATLPFITAHEAAEAATRAATAVRFELDAMGADSSSDQWAVHARELLANVEQLRQGPWASGVSHLTATDRADIETVIRILDLGSDMEVARSHLHQARDVRQSSLRDAPRTRDARRSRRSQRHRAAPPAGAGAGGDVPQLQAVDAPTDPSTFRGYGAGRRPGVAVDQFASPGPEPVVDPRRSAGLMNPRTADGFAAWWIRRRGVPVAARAISGGVGRVEVRRMLVSGTRVTEVTVPVSLESTAVWRELVADVDRYVNERGYVLPGSGDLLLVRVVPVVGGFVPYLGDGPGYGEDRAAASLAAGIVAALGLGGDRRRDAASLPPGAEPREVTARRRAAMLVSGLGPEELAAVAATLDLGELPEPEHDPAAPSGEELLLAAYGRPVSPSYFRSTELDSEAWGELRLNPLWTLAEQIRPARVVRVRRARWLYAVLESGQVVLGSESVMHSHDGYTQPMLDPDQRSELSDLMAEANPRTPLTTSELVYGLDKLGHASLAVSFAEDGRAVPGRARIAGELYWSSKADSWAVNDRSGRYMSLKSRGRHDPGATAGALAVVAEQLAEVLGVPVVAEPTARLRWEMARQSVAATLREFDFHSVTSGAPMRAEFDARQFTHGNYKFSEATVRVSLTKVGSVTSQQVNELWHRLVDAVSHHLPNGSRPARVSANEWLVLAVEFDARDPHMAVQVVAAGGAATPRQWPHDTGASTLAAFIAFQLGIVHQDASSDQSGDLRDVTTELTPSDIRLIHALIASDGRNSVHRGALTLKPSSRSAARRAAEQSLAPVLAGLSGRQDGAERLEAAARLWYPQRELSGDDGLLAMRAPQARLAAAFGARWRAAGALGAVVRRVGELGPGATAFLLSSPPGRPAPREPGHDAHHAYALRNEAGSLFWVETQSPAGRRFQAVESSEPPALPVDTRLIVVDPDGLAVDDPFGGAPVDPGESATRLHPVDDLVVRVQPNLGGQATLDEFLAADEERRGRLEIGAGQEEVHPGQLPGLDFDSVLTPVTEEVPGLGQMSAPGEPASLVGDAGTSGGKKAVGAYSDQDVSLRSGISQSIGWTVSGADRNGIQVAGPGPGEPRTPAPGSPSRGGEETGDQHAPAAPAGPGASGLIPPSRMPKVEPVLVDQEFDLQQLLTDSNLAVRAGQLAINLATPGSRVRVGIAEIGAELAGQIRVQISAKRPLALTRLVIRVAAEDFAGLRLGPLLATAIVNELGIRLTLHLGPLLDPIDMCPDRQP